MPYSPAPTRSRTSLARRAPAPTPTMRAHHIPGRAAGLIAVAALLALGTVARAGPGPERIVGVHIVSRTAGSDALATTAPKRALAKVGVTLHAVIETKQGAKRRFYSDAPTIRLRGTARRAQPLDRAPTTTLSWYKVEPSVETMSNEASGSFRFEPIEYSEVLVPEWAGQGTIAADVKPTLTPYRGDDVPRGIGTMRYRLIAHGPRGDVASSGVEARRGRGSGGLSDRVHRVSLRRDNSYLGYMTEMYGQPYIWASGGTADRKHQSERLEGSDCADLMVYGMRRMGHEIPYTWTGGLHPYARTLSAGEKRQDGVYVDKNGEPIPFPRIGDLILFPRHVGALAEDRGVPGVLDTQDIMMHTLFASPREQAIGETSYAETSIEVLRWKKSK